MCPSRPRSLWLCKGPDASRLRRVFGPDGRGEPLGRPDTSRYHRRAESVAEGAKNEHEQDRFSKSPGYHPHYRGGVLERDGGYHQGPVWPWLLGPFCLATYRIGGDAKAAQDQLAAISDVIEDQAVGTIGEICDGDPPHQPRGAPVQAWSVACTLDAWRTLRQVEQLAPT